MKQINSNLLNQYIKTTKYYFKRFTKTPFQDRKNANLIIHCCHHKVGTAWFTNILSKIAQAYGMHFQTSDKEPLSLKTEIFLQMHSMLDLEKLPPYIGSHIIRDPRDIVISGYFYHLWSHEKWLHLPSEKYNNKTYQEFLNELSQEEGILTEIQRLWETPDFQNMYNWDYHNPKFIEIKYENLIHNEQDTFEQIFQHYGFSREAINFSLKVVDQFSFSKVTKRKLGETNYKSHFRSGKPGEWKEYFTQEHKNYFKKYFGDALIKFNYETNNNW